jgi:hypothetical protein
MGPCHRHSIAAHSKIHRLTCWHHWLSAICEREPWRPIVAKPGTPATRVLTHVCQVGSGGEGAAGAGQYAHPHSRSALSSSTAASRSPHHRRRRRIELVRPVQREHRVVLVRKPVHDQIRHHRSPSALTKQGTFFTWTDGSPWSLTSRMRPDSSLQLGLWVVSSISRRLIVRNSYGSFAAIRRTT